MTRITAPLSLRALQLLQRLPLLAPLALLAGASAVTGCGGPDPKMVAVTKDDGVPANSASEERLNGTAKPKPAPPPAEDPTQPFTTPVAAEPGPPAAGAGAGATAGAGAGKTGAAKSGAAGKEPAAKTATGKVSKLECKQLFDKYIDLTIGTDSRFEGIPPEMVAQLKASALSQAQSEKGDPCSTQDVSRTQYNCAMTSTSTSGWQKCMK